MPTLPAPPGNGGCPVVPANGCAPSNGWEHGALEASLASVPVGE